MSKRSTSRSSGQALLLTILAALLCACQPQTQPGPTAATRPAAAWPGYNYPEQSLAGRSVFRLDPALTRIDIVVRRDGPLARFGHDHVVTVQDPEGFLLLDTVGDGSRADLRFRPDRLSVDAAEARARHQLDTEPDAAAIEGTRENLLAHVLDAKTFPWMTLALADFELRGDPDSASVTVRINGTESSLRQPFRLQRNGARVTVDGQWLVRQTDLGIEPFSTLGGGLRVADPMEIHFHLEANSL
jgi:hypothetical protein